MKKEKSCGAIVYKIKNEKIYTLILKMQRGHFSIPKGHVENNETEVETALREIKEETNLNVTINTDFRQVITYCPFENIVKDVVFFVAEYKSGCLRVQQEEVAEAKWVLLEKAVDCLTHDSDKNVMNNAIKFIENLKKEG